MSEADLDAVARELLAAYDEGPCLPLPSSRAGGLTLAQGFAINERLRVLRSARGERLTGWKIGLTNRGAWPRFGIAAPIWGPTWDSTTVLLDGCEAQVSLAGLSQPRLEPEVAFGFASAPRAGMSLEELRGCLAWVAHSFEIVQTHYADWRFTAADCLADGALHGKLIVGPRVPVAGWATLAADLAALQLELHRDGVCQARGAGAIVLDGPLASLQTFVDAMPEHSPDWRIEPGHVVTTGTITDAQPIAAGQHWQTLFSDTPLTPLTLHLEA